MAVFLQTKKKRKKMKKEAQMKPRRKKGEGSVYQRKSDGLRMAVYKPEGSSKAKYFSGKNRGCGEEKVGGVQE